MNLIKNVKIDPVAGYHAAGVAAIKSSIVDMAGYEGCLFVFHFGTLLATSVLNCYLNGNTVNATSGTKLAGGIAHTCSAADALLAQSAIAVDIYQPDPATSRYLEAVIDPDTANAEILGITAIRYNGKVKPESVAGLIDSALAISPAAA